MPHRRVAPRGLLVGLLAASCLTLAATTDADAEDESGPRFVAEHTREDPRVYEVDVDAGEGAITVLRTLGVTLPSGGDTSDADISHFSEDLSSVTSYPGRTNEVPEELTAGGYGTVLSGEAGYPASVPTPPGAFCQVPWVARDDRDGHRLWTRRWYRPGVSGCDFVYAYDHVVSHGVVYVVGDYTAGRQGSAILTRPFVLAVRLRDGKILAARSFARPEDGSTFHDVAVVGDTLVVTGAGPDVSGRYRHGVVFLAGLDPADLSPRWRRQFPETGGDDYGWKVSGDGTTGYAVLTLDWAYRVLRFREDGHLLWAHSEPSGSDPHVWVYDIVTGPAGPVVVGAVSGGVHEGTTPAGEPSARDGLVEGLSPLTGDVRWALRSTDERSDAYDAGTMASASRLAVVGTTIRPTDDPDEEESVDRVTLVDVPGLAQEDVLRRADLNLRGDDGLPHPAARRVVDPGRRAFATLLLDSSGTVPTDVTLRGCRPTNGVATSVRRGGADVTSQVRRGGYRTGRVSAGQRVRLRVVVTVARGATPGPHICDFVAGAPGSGTRPARARLRVVVAR